MIRSRFSYAQRFVIFAVLGLAWGAHTAQADQGLIDAGVTIELSEHSAYKNDNPIYFDARIEPEFDIALPGNWKLATISRFLVDGGDRLEPGRPSQAARSSFNRRLLLGDQAELELREFYISGPALGVYWTIGKQQIVWGKADRIRVLDLVNPHSFREFILRDFDESRIPLWSVRAEKDLGGLLLETVFVPDRTYADLPESGAEFALSSPRFQPLLPASRQSVTLREPVGVNRGNDYGIRASGFLKGWDYSLVYFRHTEDAPVFTTAANAGTAIITPHFNRSHLIGGALSNAIGDFTIRTEASGQLERALTGIVASESNLPDTTTAISYVLGIDIYSFENTLITGQFYQDRLLGAAFTNRPKVDSFVTAAIRRSFKNDQVKLHLRSILNLVDDDMLIQGSVEYSVRDGVTLFASTDVFVGDRDGVFGQFEDSSRASIGIRAGL